MDKSEADTEAAIQEKGLNAPRLTPDHIDGEIVASQFHVFSGSQLTVCCLTLRNGYTVTGESACASRENFDAEIGQKIAYENARKKIWALEGYLLKQRLYEERVCGVQSEQAGEPSEAVASDEFQKYEGRTALVLDNGGDE